MVAIPSAVVPESSGRDPVVAAVRAVDAAAALAGERHGLAAAALAVAAILDDPKHVATQPAAAWHLVSIPGTLTNPTYRRRKLALVKSMT